MTLSLVVQHLHHLKVVGRNNPVNSHPRLSPLRLQEEEQVIPSIVSKNNSLLCCGSYLKIFISMRNRKIFII